MEGNERTSSENTLNGGFQMTLRSFGDYSKYMQVNQGGSSGGSRTTLQSFGDYLKDMRGELCKCAGRRKCQCDGLRARPQEYRGTYAI